MKRINEQRPKAFVGALIGLAGSVVGGILSSNAKKKEEAKQRAINRARMAHETNINQANSSNETFANLEQNKEILQENFQNKFMRTGGKTSKSSELSPRKGVTPNIAEGGKAIPIKKNTYLLKGRKHETGGIVIGKGKKSIEAEGDEVVQITPKNLKVFSAQPIINGNSPAELVQRGVKPDKVFNAQERFKDINGLNDDGTRKKKVMGGKDEVKQDNVRVYRPEIIEPIERKISPADRVNAPVGTRYSDLSPEDKFRLKRSDKLNEDYQGLEGSSPEFDVALAAATGGLSGLYKASASAGRQTGANLVKGFAKGTGKELAYDVATRVASEINPTLGLVTGLIPRSGGISATKATRATKTTKAATRTIESKGTTKDIEVTTRAAKPVETTDEVTKIAGLLESPEKMTRDQLKKINAVAKRFGYKPIPLDYAKDRVKAEKAVKDLVNQHNTFLRGVHPLTLEERYYVGKELKKQGLEVNEDNIYKYVVTHTAPPTGAGRADIPGDIKGALYTSNSGNQSVGYANESKFKFPGEIEGIIAKVRRPTKFNSPRMTDWWVDNDFNFANEMSYYKRKLLDENIAKYGKLPDNIRNEIKSSEDAIFNTRLKEFESDINNNNRYYNDIIHSRIKYIDEKNLSKPSHAVKYERYNMDNASAIEKIAYGEYLYNIIKNGRKKSYSEFLKEERARVTREFRIKAHNKAIKEVAEKQGYKFDPNKANIYYAKHYGLHSITRNTGNPRQHFIFTGEPGIKKLDFIDYYKPTKEEILTGSRDHDRAVYTEGFSRRTRRLGGTINKNNTVMRLGGISRFGSNTRLLKNNYNNFGLEKDYSNSFAPNALTKANMNSVKTNSVVAGKPITGTSKGGFKNFMSKTGKGIGNWLNSSGGEALSAGIGAVGSIVSALTNKSSIDAIQPANIPTPKAVRPAKMKTNYNINPQLSEVTENERNLRRVIDSNTSSSAASISRQQRVANDAVMQRNKLRGTKENIETQLYNQDALNRQEVESRNTAAINETNKYNAISSAQTANEKIQAKANNRTQMIESLTGAVRDYQLGVDTRRRDDLAFAAEAAKNPEQFDLFMNLMKKHKGAIRQLGFRLGGENKLLCGGRKKVS